MLLGFYLWLVLLMRISHRRVFHYLALITLLFYNTFGEALVPGAYIAHGFDALWFPRIPEVIFDFTT